MTERQGTEIRGAVLVADDHEVVRYGITRLLRDEFGVRHILEAERFPDALKMLMDQSIVLALFDLDMPGMEGPEALAEVRLNHPDVKLVVLSASQSRSDILSALDAGVHGYIVKSERIGGLSERLRYIMSGQIYVPPILAEQPVNNGHLAISRISREKDNSVGPGLSERQLQVLKGLVAGLSNKQIARELKLAEGTVKMHIGALFRALGASNRAHAAALGRGLLG